MKDPYDRNMFAASAAEMVVDASSANRVLLVGKLDKDRRLPGILDQFQINTDDVINICADTLYRKGLLEDAVMMYDLARNHEKVLSLMCTLLTQVVSQRGPPGSLRARLQVAAMDISARYNLHDYNDHANIFKFKLLFISIVNLFRYKDIAIQAPSEVVCSFYTLRDLMVFFDQFHNEQYQSALRVSTLLLK